MVILINDGLASIGVGGEEVYFFRDFVGLVGLETCDHMDYSLAPGVQIVSVWFPCGSHSLGGAVIDCNHNT